MEATDAHGDAAADEGPGRRPAAGPGSWGLGVAALVAGLLAVAIAVVLIIGVRGLI